MPRSFRTLLPLAACALLLAAAPAHASTSQEVTFEAPRDLHDPGKRAATFDELQSLGVRSLRVILYWGDVAPDRESRVKPKLDMTDPSVYDWSKYDPVIGRVTELGWKLHLTVSGPVPRWATNGARDTVSRPSPNEFRMFMTAVSKRYGTQVDRYAIWNEPNHPDFLGPQFDRRKRPTSPTIYRGLYAAALRGLEDAGDTTPVLMGETAPTGTGKVVAPLAFLRGALCLNDSYKKRGKCAKLRVDGIAHHPYTRRSGPFYKPGNKDDVTIGVLSRLVKATDRMAKAGVVPKRVPLHLTEFGIQSTPDPLYGVPLLQQNEYRNISELIAYRNPRVKVFSQYLLTDDQPIEGVPKIARYGGFESGLRSASGKDKPALEGFRLPLVAEERSGSKVRLWGLVRPAGGVTEAIVEQRDGKGAWKRLATITTNSRGVFTRNATGRKNRQWRLRWTSPDGRTYTSPGVRSY